MLGLILLIIPGLILAVLLWTFYWLIVDQKTAVMESFGAAYEVGKLNAGTTILLSLTCLGIVILGCLALCVGLLFAAPLTTMIWAVAYLMMTGQPVAGK